MKLLLVLHTFYLFGFADESFPSIPAEYKDHKKFNLLDLGENCGYSSVNRIIGGQHAALGEYPWIVRIGYNPNPEVVFSESYECGGSIISDIYILTAAHCSPKYLKQEWVEIRAGEHDASQDRDCDDKGVCAALHQDIAVSDYFCHEGYESSNRHNDICILRLEKPIKFNTYVQPICLPFYDNILNGETEGKTMEVAGWGVSNIETKEMATILLKLKVPIMDESSCVKAYALRADIVPDQICAGGEERHDSCNGDSGGPLMTPYSVGGAPRYFLMGVVSYGPEPCGSEKGTPGVYTNVRNYLHWILDNLPTSN